MKTIASIGLLSVLAACGVGGPEGGEPTDVDTEKTAPAETPDLAAVSEAGPD